MTEELTGEQFLQLLCGSAETPETIAKALKDTRMATQIAMTCGAGKLLRMASLPESHPARRPSRRPQRMLP